MLRRCGVTRFASDFILSSIIAILLALASAAPVEAQTGSVNLEGTVYDPSGDPLQGATLTAVEQYTGRQVETVADSDGNYRFLALLPGTYTVTAKAKGLKDVIHRGILVFAPGSTYESFSFEVAAIDKDIPPGEYPRFFDSDATFFYSQRDMESYPILDRNPLELSIYQPGVQINGGNENQSTVNGTRLAMNSILMDGLSITDPIDPRLLSPQLTTNPNAVSDLEIVTTGGKAEYGRSAGAQSVLVSRSGGKTWSGNFYDYLSNRIFNANNFFNNSFKIPRPGLARNIFGAAAGGPVGKNTRVFGYYEGNRTKQQLIRNRTVLTDEAKAGLFRWFTPDDTVRDDSTMKTYDIAANDPRGLGIDPTVAALIARLPEPNNDSIGDGLNIRGYRFDNPVHTNQDRFAVRVDRSVSDKHHLFVRFNWDRTDATDILNNAEAPYVDEPAGNLNVNNWGVAVGSDYAISPNMINELRIGYLRPRTELKRDARSTGLMIVPNSFNSPLDASFPRSFETPAFEINDNLSLSKKQHFLKYGFTYRRTLQSNLDFTGVYPNATFGRDHGNAPASSIGPSEQSEISSTGRITFENLYNDLLGRVESIGQTFNANFSSFLPAGTARDRNFASQEYAAFIQDNWRAKPNLTINVGLRYEFSTVPHEKNGLQAVLDKASQISKTANIEDFVFVQGDNWYSRKMTNFAPRIGFAWDMFSSGKTLIRGGYGVYYDRLIGGITNIIDQNTSPLSKSVATYPNQAETDLRLSDTLSFPQQPGAPETALLNTRSADVAVLDPNLSTPRVHHFSIALEKRWLGAVFEVGYVGTRGKKLFQYLNFNQTKTGGDFLQAFKELQAYRSSGTPVSDTNTLVRIFGTPLAAMNALEASNLDSGQAGLAANNLDLSFSNLYASAGVSDFYIRNFPQFETFAFGTNSAESRYDALQVGIRKSTQNSHLRAYYTWSKSTDNMSTDGSAYVSARDSFNPGLSKTPSDFDRTHVVTLAYDYALPIGRTSQDDSDMPRWVGFLFGGWNLGALLVWESGPRFSVNSGLQTQYANVPSLANLSADANRDLLGNIVQLNGRVYWFDTDQLKQFTFPAAGEDGNSGRNSFTGPKYINLDCVLHKKFMVGEKQAIQFRFEAYNVINRANFGPPNTNIFDSGFGIISSTKGNPRTLQVALRYQF